MECLEFFLWNSYVVRKATTKRTMAEEIICRHCYFRNSFSKFDSIHSYEIICFAPTHIDIQNNNLTTFILGKYNQRKHFIVVMYVSYSEYQNLIPKYKCVNFKTGGFPLFVEIMQ